MQSKTIVTAKLLERLNACPNQVVIFRKIFGESAEANLINLHKALNAKLAVGWFGIKLYWAKCQPLSDEYWAKCQHLSDEYWAKCQHLGDEYEAKCQHLGDEYETKCQHLGEEYEAKCQSLYDEYEVKYGKILLKLLIKNGIPKRFQEAQDAE